MVFKSRLAQATLLYRMPGVRSSTSLQGIHRNMKKSPYTPSPEEQALSEARKQLRREKKATQSSVAENLTATNSRTLLCRSWVTLKDDGVTDGGMPRRATILTWNLLAQCLIRRELFPTSDCLKAAQRESLIHQEIIRQNADILCLQEVDRLDKLYPMLNDAGYSYHYASGPRKLHGCLIAFKKELYSLTSDRVVFYDEQNVGTEDNIGATFKTRNIGSLVALKRQGDDDQGLIIATTHLFWHPRYTYERIRQTGILIREVSIFKKKLKVSQWPTVVAGDFNFDPSDPAYSLITGDSLLPTQEEKITPSMVIHSSIDPSVSIAPSAAKSAGDDEAEGVDPDRHITNARAPTSQDGLLSVTEISEWFTQLPKFRSLYDEGLAKSHEQGTSLPMFGQRVCLPVGRHGANEPEYTSFTHYWQSVLDYIFVADSPNCPVKVVGFLAPLTGKDMEPGLPQKHVSGSDHTCLVVEISW